jgi:hypothetical protein
MGKKLIEREFRSPTLFLKVVTNEKRGRLGS